MPRASRLDPDACLDAAMALFWSRGYGAVSIDDLVQATGTARYGLYAAFADKRGLYLAALARYRDVIVDRQFSGVEAAGAGPVQVRGYFDALLAMAAQGWGCLMVNAMIERAPEDAAVAKFVEAHRLRLRTGFAAAKANPDLLANLAFGVAAAARAGAPLDSLSAAIDTALARD